MTEKTFFSNQGEFIAPHTVILDRLDFWNYNNGEMVYYDSKAFEKAIPTIENEPIIFARKHAKNSIVNLNLEDALKEVDGKVVGTVKTVSINNTGSPKLLADVDVTDSEVNDMINDGKIYLSHAFDGYLDAQKRIYGIDGNHVLFYPTDTGIPPGDRLATFLNQGIKPQILEGEIHTTEKTDKNETPSIEFFANQYTDNVQTIATLRSDVENQKVTIQNQGAKITELESTISELTEKASLVEDQTITIQNQGTRILDLENELTTLKAEKLESEKKAFMNQFAPGVQKQFEGRITEYDNPNSRAWLINDMWKAQAAVPQPNTEVSGTVSVMNQGEEPVSDGVSIQKDPVTGRLVSKVLIRGA
jgi:hypothetical protein